MEDDTGGQDSQAVEPPDMLESALSQAIADMEDADLQPPAAASALPGQLPLDGQIAPLSCHLTLLEDRRHPPEARKGLAVRHRLLENAWSCREGRGSRAGRRESGISRVFHAKQVASQLAWRALRYGITQQGATAKG